MGRGNEENASAWGIFLHNLINSTKCLSISKLKLKYGITLKLVFFSPSFRKSLYYFKGNITQCDITQWLLLGRAWSDCLAHAVGRQQCSGGAGKHLSRQRCTLNPSRSLWQTTNRQSNRPLDNSRCRANLTTCSWVQLSKGCKSPWVGLWRQILPNKYIYNVNTWQKNTTI